MLPLRFLISAGLRLNFVADVFLTVGEADIANACNGGIDAQGQNAQPEIGAGAALVSLGSKVGVIDDHTAQPTKEKCQQKTNDVFTHKIPSEKFFR